MCYAMAYLQVVPGLLCFLMTHGLRMNSIELIYGRTLYHHLETGDRSVFLSVIFTVKTSLVFEQQQQQQ